MRDILVEIYRIVLEQYGIAGGYIIHYDPKQGGSGWLRITDEWHNPIVEGAPEYVLHQAKQW